MTGINANIGISIVMTAILYGTPLVFAGIGFLWILRDPERQAWHDRIAGTFVVNVPRNWPI